VASPRKFPYFFSSRLRLRARRRATLLELEASSLIGSVLETIDVRIITQFNAISLVADNFDMDLPRSINISTINVEPLQTAES